jgi:hypothetical protein
MAERQFGRRGTWLFAGALMATAGLVFLFATDSPPALGWSLIAIGVAFTTLGAQSANR